MITKRSPLQQWARDLGLGVALYHGYHAPKGLMQHYLRRDPFRRAGDERASQHMETAAYQLPPLQTGLTAPLGEIHFLSGQRFWYQTCFCAYSLIQQSGQYLRPVIYDDGSLAPQHQAEIARIFPDSRIVTRGAIETRLDTCLPWKQFPTLRSRRLEYPNLRKLTDIHAGTQGWKLVLDSDMLCWRSPTLLLEWLRSPQQPCYMVDVETSYGYSPALMTALAQAPIPERVNVGICGLNSNTLDWDELEFWCRTLQEREGTHYYQEQAMLAMLMARQFCVVAPESDYVVMPTRAEVKQPQAILHHYVADAKPWYFRYAWQQVLGLS